MLVLEEASEDRPGLLSDGFLFRNGTIILAFLVLLVAIADEHHTCCIKHCAVSCGCHRGFLGHNIYWLLG